MKKMVCRGCESTRNVPTERNVDKWACDVCNGEMTHEALDYDLTDLNEAQADFLRSVNDTVIVRANSTIGKLHIPSDGEPLCEQLREYNEKPIDVYPPGYAEWCNVCLAKASYRTASSGRKGFDTTKRSCLKAIQRAQLRLGHWPTEREYRDLNISPSATTIRRRFDGWRNAKETAIDEF